MVFQLIYTCALRSDVDSSELDRIAKTSRARNMTKGLTGILLCKDGSVLQVLEGDEKVVKDLYEKISKDPRVSNLLIMIQRNGAEREFPNWSMGYRNADTDDNIFDLKALSYPTALPKNASPEMDTISRTFARVNGLS